MAKFPYLTSRKGTRSLYYKRPVPGELRAEGRPAQIWKSLKTADRKLAERAYAAIHADVERLFEEWRRLDQTSPAARTAEEGCTAVTSSALVDLSPALMKRLSDAHRKRVLDEDFSWRGELWRRVEQDEASFWRGEVIRLPEDDTTCFQGSRLSYFYHLSQTASIESVFLYCVCEERESRLNLLRTRYQLGDTRIRAAVLDDLLDAHALRLVPSDQHRLLRRLMEVEIDALKSLLASEGMDFAEETGWDSPSMPGPELAPGAASSTARPVPRTSELIEKYLEEKAREREWPVKTVLRKRGELREFLEVVGDRPITAYAEPDGVGFKDIQLSLPARRNVPPFKGLSLGAAAAKANKARAAGQTLDLLNPITINDKIGTVSLFFEWAKQRDTAVVNPVAHLKIDRPRGRRRVRKRRPWTVDELNRMFAAPIYTGCRSERFWSQRGKQVLNRSAMYWVPLIGLYSGLRLGEIIQMQTGDVKGQDGIWYFDVTCLPSSAEDAGFDGLFEDEERKSLKTATSRRSVPIHKALMKRGFDQFLEFRRRSGEVRLFPEFSRAKDDASWSKQFSKHFKRFRQSIGVTRPGVDFHSLRHNVEDALRNADIRKDVRDAIQGHGENGVSRDYGSGFYVKTLNEAVQKISYKGLILPARGVGVGTLNDGSSDGIKSDQNRSAVSDGTCTSQSTPGASDTSNQGEFVCWELVSSGRPSHTSHD